MLHRFAVGGDVNIIIIPELRASQDKELVFFRGKLQLRLRERASRALRQLFRTPFVIYSAQTACMSQKLSTFAAEYGYAGVSPAAAASETLAYQSRGKNNRY